jgi:hypothetical protein
MHAFTVGAPVAMIASHLLASSRSVPATPSHVVLSAVTDVSEASMQSGSAAQVWVPASAITSHDKTRRESPMVSRGGGGRERCLSRV